jgi:hypothetical protein
MIDSTEIYVANLLESLQQLTTYTGLSLSVTVSAWVLDRPLSRNASDGTASSSPPDDVTVSALAIRLSREDARILLMGLGLVFGTMALTAASGAIRASTALQGSHGLLAAACTFPSVASSSLGVRIIGSLIPAVLICDIVRRHWRDYSRTWTALILVCYSATVFGGLAFALLRVKCPDI